MAVRGSIYREFIILGTRSSGLVIRTSCHVFRLYFKLQKKS